MVCIFKLLALLNLSERLPDSRDRISVASQCHGSPVRITLEAGFLNPQFDFLSRSVLQVGPFREARHML